MQTFLPYPCFARSALALDYRRQGKQRVEALQILRTLRGFSSGWNNHPAVRMWKGFETALGQYGLAVCAAWKVRGYRDTCAAKIVALAGDVWNPCPMPPWLGSEEFHRSHRANLVRKLPEFYGPMWPDADPGMPYFWPV